MLTFLYYYGSVNCLSHHITITDDDINEATEQLFIIQLTLVRSHFPDMINISRSFSLGIIIDDDREFANVDCHACINYLLCISAIKIGFENPNYTFIEPPFLKSFHISLIKEGNQMSEQTFQVLVQVSNMTNPFQPALLGEDYQNPTILPILFPSNQEHISWEFVLLSNEDPEENEAFRAAVSSVGSPSFITYGSNVFNETLIVIKDAQSKLYYHDTKVPTCYITEPQSRCRSSWIQSKCVCCSRA